MRCPECNKFASYSEPEAEEAGVDVDDEGRVSGNIEVTLSSECCGCAVKSALFDVSDKIDVGEAWKKHKQEAKERDDAAETPEDDREEHELVVEVDVEGDSRSQGRKQFYGYHATVTVKCSCGETIEGDAELNDELESSGFEEVA